MPVDRTPMEPMAATPEDIVAILDAHNLCRSEAARGINPASHHTAAGMPRLVQINLLLIIFTTTITEDTP